ncbi:MAG: GTPase domain-containing protein [Syntrophothermus sp.]
MKSCVVIGKSNVGKTMFAVNFAAFLGRRELAIAAKASDGPDQSWTYNVAQAISTLTGPEVHKTRHLLGQTLEMDLGKGHKPFYLLDTTGLSEGIHPDAKIRRAMAQTLGVIRDATVILHMMDASAIRRDQAEAVGEVDLELANFARARPGYAILANKMDLPAAQEGLVVLKHRFRGLPIFPISALHRQGFREVKRFVAQHI